MENADTKKKGLIALLIIFCFMFIMNLVTPLWADDYFAAFVWPEGVRMLGDFSPETLKVSNYMDLFHNLKTYYLTWGGRLPGSLPVSLFVWKGKHLFNVVNAFMMTLLVIEIYWLTHEGKITFSFDIYFLFLNFILLWIFNISFVDTCLWLSGSCNYLWMMCVVLAFLLPYIRSYYDSHALQRNHFRLAIVLFVLGLLAGWSHETTIVWVIFLVAYLVQVSNKIGNLQLWKVTGFIGLCLGYIFLIFAPGNFSRLVAQQYKESTFISNQTPHFFINSELFFPKLIEMLIIFYFHLVLWYLVVLFFLKYKKRYSEPQLKSNIVVIKATALIALGSNILMFLIPASGIRPSFVGLVFLIISAVSILRLQEKTNVIIINEKAKRFLKFVGCSYFIITVVVSLGFNIINWAHWNDIIEKVKLEVNNPSNTVLVVQPYVTEKMNLSPIITHLIHIIDMPISDNENINYNVMFSNYYHLKGIKVERD